MVNYYDALLARNLAGGSATLQDKSVSITANGDSTILPDSGYDGLSKVDVSVNVAPPTPIASNDVDFIDYDGTIVAAYSAADFANLTEMPTNPTHDGVVSQGWNWSLSDAKAHVAKYGKLTIGQMYATTSGSTRLYIDIPEGVPASMRRPTLSVFIFSGGGGYSVDFNDGNTPQHFTSSNSNIRPVAALDTGEHIIDITPDEGATIYLGHNNNPNSESDGSALIGLYSYTDKINATNFDNFMLKRIAYAGQGTQLSNCALGWNTKLVAAFLPRGLFDKTTYKAFYNCNALKCVIFPSGSYNTVLGFICLGCGALERVSIPYGITKLGKTNSSSLFAACYSLKRVELPDTLVTINSTTFSSCVGLTEITIPENVTQIGSTAFAYCTGLSKVVFAPTTPPTLDGSNAFNYLPTDCKIYVPYSEDHSVLNAYKTATNYPNPSTYTYVEY